MPKFLNTHSGVMINMDSVVSIEVSEPVYDPDVRRYTLSGTIHYGVHGDLRFTTAYDTLPQARMAYQYPMNAILDDNTSIEDWSDSK